METPIERVMHKRVEMDMPKIAGRATQRAGRKQPPGKRRAGLRKTLPSRGTGQQQERGRVQEKLSVGVTYGHSPTRNGYRIKKQTI